MTDQRDLFLLRHGQAEDILPGLVDHARHLTAHGREEAFATAKGFVSKLVLPDLILCSDAQRTRETSEQVARALGGSAPLITFEPNLYQANHDMLLRLLEDHLGSEARVLVIGHNPALSRLVSNLSGERVQLSTAEVAHLSIEGCGWQPALRILGGWTLKSIWRGSLDA